MTERVKRMIGLAPRQTGNKIIINCEKLEKRVALLENGVLEEYTIERPSDRNIVGSIFKGRVKNIEHGLKAMFVDIGYEKNAFLHFWDALPAALDSGIEEVERKDRKQPKKITSKDIPVRILLRMPRMARESSITIARTWTSDPKNYTCLRAKRVRERLQAAFAVRLP